MGDIADSFISAISTSHTRVAHTSMRGRREHCILLARSNRVERVVAGIPSADDALPVRSETAEAGVAAN